MIIENDFYNSISKHSNKFVDVICDNCGKQFKRKKNSVVLAVKHYCCKECQSEFKQKKAKKEMDAKVGMDFQKYLREQYLNNKKTTREIAKMVYGKSTSSSNILHWLHKFNIPLRQGGEAVKIQWINNESRRKKTSERAKKNFLKARDKVKKIQQTKEYKEKARKAKMGELNPMFGKIGDLNPRYDKTKTMEWRIKNRKTAYDRRFIIGVKNKYNNTCAKCGIKRDKYMVAHHILSYLLNPEKRYDINNGICFCPKCHKLFHHIYGINANDKDLEEFLK